MAYCDGPHKSFSRRLLCKLDQHPRLGWFLAAWIALIGLDSALNLVDRVLRLL